MIGHKIAGDTRDALGHLIDDGWDLKIGRYTYGIPRLHGDKSDGHAQLDIGSFCSIGGNCQIWLGLHGRHPVDFISTFPLSMAFGAPAVEGVSKARSGALGVSIGCDVWIAEDVSILAGVTIGHGAVIGAKSLVVGDVAPYSIVGGVPARHIRYRFGPEEIGRLLALRWWEWEDEAIRDNLHLFHSPDTAACLDGMEDVQRGRGLDG